MTRTDRLAVLWRGWRANSRRLRDGAIRALVYTGLSGATVWTAIATVGDHEARRYIASEAGRLDTLSHAPITDTLTAHAAMIRAVCQDSRLQTEILMRMATRRVVEESKRAVCDSTWKVRVR